MRERAGVKKRGCRERQIKRRKERMRECVKRDVDGEGKGGREREREREREPRGGLTVLAVITRWIEY